MNKKKDKKRKRTDDASKKSRLTYNTKEQAAVIPKKSLSSTVKATSAAQEARSAVRSAVESNPVLSNLFGSKKNSSEKERRDALFTRNC